MLQIGQKEKEKKKKKEQNGTTPKSEHSLCTFRVVEKHGSFVEFILHRRWENKLEHLAFLALGLRCIQKRRFQKMLSN